ncbi:MAG: class II aldolase/adducin family protein [Deltaproteobacteria bacterium]
MSEQFLRQGIIDIGKKLYALRLVVARSGNLSARIDQSHILITASGTSLGNLNSADIIKVDISKGVDTKEQNVSSEFPLHRAVYKNFPAKVIIHCHPSLINGYFAVCSDIKPLTFETKFYLGRIPVVSQDTPTVTNLEPVMEALKTSNLTVIKNHGVISVGDNFDQALYLIEALEEAIKTAALARIFKKNLLDDLDAALKEKLSPENFQDGIAYEMFSKEHVTAIVDAVNHDEFIAAKGRELDLTVKLAVELEGTDKIYKFNFEKGRVTAIEYDRDAPFVISAGDDAWRLIFLGKLDPFVAATQGKIRLKGELAKLSRWYVPFSRLFEIFKQVKIK